MNPRMSFTTGTALQQHHPVIVVGTILNGIQL
jgi:hypothetical protein